MRYHFAKLLPMFALLFLGTLSANAQDPQCRFFGSGQCDSYLDDFKSNGQMNNAAVSPGESVSLNMVFYKGHDYRLVLCTEEHLGDVAWRVETSKGDVLFNNEDSDYAMMWDFSMQKTARFVLKVDIPGEDDEEAVDGCIALSVGLKPSVKRGFK